jgi:hypothetical protein
MKITYIDWMEREFIKANPTKLFVFGDNEQRVGMGGQAYACRGEENTQGICVKHTPGGDDKAFYNDANLEANKQQIIEDIFLLVKRYVIGYDEIVFPSAGVGTGLALLKTEAPKTYEFLVATLAKIGITNETKPIVEK